MMSGEGIIALQVFRERGGNWGDEHEGLLNRLPFYNEEFRPE